MTKYMVIALALVLAMLFGTATEYANAKTYNLEASNCAAKSVLAVSCCSCHCPN